MSYVGPDTFLDIITLSVTDPLPEFLEAEQISGITSQAIVLIENIIKTETIYDTEENKYFLELTKELLLEKMTWTDKSRLGNFSSKWLKKFPDSDDLTIKRILASALMPEDESHHPTDKFMYTIYDKMKQNVSVMIAERELKQMNGKVKKAARTSDLLTQQLVLEEALSSAQKMITEIKELGAVSNKSMNIEYIDLGDKASIKHALVVNRVVRKTTLFKFGLQGLNDMLGDGEGMMLGETVLFAALSHHYKTGILLDTARSIAMYTDPPKFDENIPAIVFISLESEAHNNLMNLYKRTYIQEHGVEPSGEVDDDAMSTYISDVFSKRGWKFILIRRIGEYFTFEEFVKIYNDFLKKGIRIYVNVIDYPGNMNLGLREHNDGGSQRAKAFQILYRRFADFARYNSVLNVLAHQLDTPASFIVAAKTHYAVKKFHGRSHLADGKAIYNEVDLMIMMCIETNTAGISFLTFMWAKHREKIAPPVEKQFTAYPFGKLGIMDDINSPVSKEVKDIYSYREKTFDDADVEDLFR